MNKINLRKQYNSDFSQLKKIINSWELFDGAQNDEFDDLNNKILSHLYNSTDFEKLSRVISSELTTNYGVYYDEFEAIKLAKEVFKWWKEKS